MTLVFRVHTSTWQHIVGSLENKKSAHFFEDWKRSPILRVGAGYLVGAWAIVQVCEVVLPSYNVAPEVMQIIINSLAVMFPVVLLIARFTNVSRLFGSEGRQAAEVASIGPTGEAEEILRLRSAALEFPVSLSERRWITTVTCSVRGVRSGKDDPELLLGVISGIEDELQYIVDRYEGTRLPSGRNEIVVAFGYPAMHEDDARRAAKTALEIIALIQAQDRDDDPTTLVVGQAGLHTDVVIVDDLTEDGDAVALLGGTTAITEWLLALAPENGVAMSAASSELLKEYFQIEQISRLSHPRLGKDVPVFSLGKEYSGQLRQVIARGEEEPIGRDHELQILLDHWQTVIDGESRYVLLIGEPGIGKSTLLYRTVRELFLSDSTRLVALNCESYYQESPLRPVIGYLEQRIFENDHTLPQAERLKRLREFLQPLAMDVSEALPLLATLLSVVADDLALTVDDSSRLIRKKTLKLLVDLFHDLARMEPVVLIIEDLHWVDPSTKDLIELLLTESPEHRIYGLFTSRPEFETQWARLPHFSSLDLGRLPSRVSEELIRRRLGSDRVSASLIKHVAQEAHGIPLYIEELARGLNQSGTPLDAADPAKLSIPKTLQAILTARIDRLGPSKPLLQLCSVIGLEFSYALLLKVVQADDEKLLRKVLAALVSEGVLYQKGTPPDVIYRFQHRLLMDAAYESLIRKTQQQLHQAIGVAIEESFPELCISFPVLLAQHFERSDDVEKSMHYRIKAIEKAHRQFANDEAMTQLIQGFETLQRIQDPRLRDSLELALQNLKGGVLLSSQGFTNPDAMVAFERAVELSASAEQSPELFKMLVGLWMYYLIKPDNSKSKELSERLLNLAVEIGDDPELLQANYCMGYSLYYVGELDDSVRYFKRALEFEKAGCDYTKQTPTRDDSRVHLHCMLGVTLWLVGESERAKAELSGALALSVECNHPYGQVWALFQAALLYHMQGDFGAMLEATERLLSLSVEKGFSFFVPLGRFLEATQIEGPDERLAAMIRHHEETKLIGARAGSTYFGSVIAEELIAQRKLEEATGMLQVARELMESQGERLWEGEIIRLEVDVGVRGGELSSEEGVSLLRDGVRLSRAMNNKPFAVRGAQALYDLSGGLEESKALLEAIVGSYSVADATKEFRKAEQIAANHVGS